MSTARQKKKGPTTGMIVMGAVMLLLATSAGYTIGEYDQRIADRYALQKASTQLSLSNELAGMALDLDEKNLIGDAVKILAIIEAMRSAEEILLASIPRG